MTDLSEEETLLRDFDDLGLEEVVINMDLEIDDETAGTHYTIHNKRK